MDTREEGNDKVNDPDLEIIRLKDEIEMLKKDLHDSKQAEHRIFMDAVDINVVNDRLRIENTQLQKYKRLIYMIANEPIELSHHKIQDQYIYWKEQTKKLLAEDTTEVETSIEKLPIMDDF